MGSTNREARKNGNGDIWQNIEKIRQEVARNVPVNGRCVLWIIDRLLEERDGGFKKK